MAGGKLQLTDDEMKTVLTTLQSDLKKKADAEVAAAGDAQEINRIRNKSLNTLASGPFPPDNAAHIPPLEHVHNLKKAKALAQEYEQKHGEPIRFEYLALTAPETIAFAELVKEQQAKAGIEVTIRTLDLSAFINDALAGNFQSAGWLNHPGGDPDTQYAWWHSASPVNFGRLNDPVIDKDLVSSLLARQLGAQLFVVSTGVERVAIHFNTPQQQWLGEVSLARLEGYAREMYVIARPGK